MINPRPAAKPAPVYPTIAARQFVRSTWNRFSSSNVFTAVCSTSSRTSSTATAAATSMRSRRLLLFNIGNAELTAGELRSRGYYLGSNVSYNLKKLVDLGFINHQRSRVDRRSVRVSLTPKGADVAEVVGGLYERHVGSIEQVGGINADEFKQMNRALQRLDRFWNDTIAYRM